MSSHLALSLLMLSAVQVVSGSVELDQEDISVNIGADGELRRMAKDIEQHGRAGALASNEGATSTLETAAPATPLEDLQPIKDATRTDAPRTCTASLGNMDKCQSGKETQCSSWSSGLSSGQKLALGAAVQAAGGRLASKLQCKSIRSSSSCARLLLQRPTHRDIMRAVSPPQKSFVRSEKVRKTKSNGRGAGLVETSDAKACVDPSVADPATWCCECWSYAQSQCKGVDEGCIHRLMCKNPNICQSWKDAQPSKCQTTTATSASAEVAPASAEVAPVSAEVAPVTTATTATTAKGHKGHKGHKKLMLERSQSNTESDDTRTGNIDHSVVGKCDSEDR